MVSRSQFTRALCAWKFLFYHKSQRKPFRDIKPKRQGQMCILESVFHGSVRNEFKGPSWGKMKNRQKDSITQ